MHAGHRGVGEGAGCLARTEAGVDPGVVEKAPADVGELGREGAVGGQHDIAGLVPGDGAVVVLRERRVAVPVIELVLPQPGRLVGVVAVREPGMGLAHGVDQGLHHLGLDLVGQVAGLGRQLIAPPAVLDLLVLGQGVGDQRQERALAFQHPGDFLGGAASALAVGIAEAVQRLFQGHALALDLEAEPGHGLVEEPHPGGPPGDVFFVQQRLQPVFQLVGPEDAQVAQPGGVMGQPGRGFELGGQVVFFQPVELEAEEN